MDDAVNSGLSRLRRVALMNALDRLQATASEIAAAVRENDARAEALASVPGCSKALVVASITLETIRDAMDAISSLEGDDLAGAVRDLVPELQSRADAALLRVHSLMHERG